MSKKPLVILDLVPSLRNLVESAGLNADNLSVGLPMGPGHPGIANRNSIIVTDAEKSVTWPVGSLRELFRGQRQPPPDIDHYPPEYMPHFFFLESHVMKLGDAIGDRTDQEMNEIYSNLRRRPDGRSMGIGHDYLWQVTALLLGRIALSEAEFGGILGALARSTSKWSLRPVSRNYLDYLRRNFPASQG
jgi:hypothetical protein